MTEVTNKLNQPGLTLEEAQELHRLREAELMDETFSIVGKILQEKSWSDFAKDAAIVVESVNPQLSGQIASATTPESLVPLLKRALGAVGRKSRFDNDKVSPAEWETIVKAYVSVLYRTLDLATFMMKERK
jgi:hypothetical protein